MIKSPLIAALVLSSAAFAAAAQAHSEQGGQKLSTTLNGAAERPGPGDPDGSGSFKARLNPGTGQLCYTLTVSHIATATAAHIHEAPPTAAGPVVVSLSAPASGSSEACISIAKELAKEILKTPGDYYVNVHNAVYPSGAVRGQLANK